MQGEIVGGGYPPPVDRLLTLGDPRKLDHPSRESRGWPDYRRYGFGPAHVPDLIRLAGDEVFNNGDPESREVWAPLHAWRALGQLGAADAVAPLLDVLSSVDEDDDWSREELPEVFGLIGAEAIPALAAYLADDERDTSNRVTITTALEKIGLQHPNARDESVRVLSHQLERFKDNDPELNGFIISALMGLTAVEAAPLMQQAFETGGVDLIVVGDWDDVRVELGLLPARIQLTQPPPEGSRSPLARRFGLPPFTPIPPPSLLDGPLGPLLTGAGPDKADKAKRKVADKSRKRNRKRK